MPSAQVYNDKGDLVIVRGDTGTLVFPECCVVCNEPVAKSRIHKSFTYTPVAFLTPWLIFYHVRSVDIVYSLCAVHKRRSHLAIATGLSGIAIGIMLIVFVDHYLAVFGALAMIVTSGLVLLLLPRPIRLTKLDNQQARFAVGPLFVRNFPDAPW